MPFRRPWTVRHNESAFWVEDAKGMCFAFTYFTDTPIAGTGREKPTRDEARRLTLNVARLGAGDQEAARR
jgi:hypothetical protein